MKYLSVKVSSLFQVLNATQFLRDLLPSIDLEFLLLFIVIH